MANMASRSYSVCVLCRRSGFVRMLMRGMSTSAQPQPQIDFLKGVPHKRHPGVTNLKTLRLPEELQAAAQIIIQDSKERQLPERAQKLSQYLWSRKRAVEDSALRKKAVSLEREYWNEAMEKITGEFDEEALDNKIRRKVLTELKKTTYHWTPMKYDEEVAVVYMAARLAGGYAAVRRALNEIKKRDPAFAPHSLLDFGSGLGTVVWAAHSHWAESLKEMICVDSSGPMNILAERLLRGDDEKAQPHIKHVYFRHFLPVSPKVQFDLVVSAFTLSELQSVKDREEAVFTLWRKTSSYLVLIENGTMEGHQILMEARDSLLTKQEKMVHDPRPASVFAPCPHERTCPKLTGHRVLPCNFVQLYQPVSLPRFPNNSPQREKFSYLILTRSGSQQEETEGLDWARLVAPVLRRSRHVHCHTCGSDGELKHLVVTTSKYTKDIYRCARNSEWGDQLPLLQTEEEDEEEGVQNQSDSE
ncbi:methyltransferase-like protein 17, mitochondrial [Cynoglossus semilaevis]|uniref:Ribosome assembly protein METTL17, mitochondrial n=1 Tax=Cynoglossus semilaevis TaxID=244447 RepID=A0A3P8X341_CYNSE|nr:methyltransferase-like protein 17, mitochondrial [Cynoglossus semilaevis]